MSDLAPKDPVAEKFAIERDWAEGPGFRFCSRDTPSRSDESDRKATDFLDWELQT